MWIVIFLKFLTAITALKNDLKIVGYFLLGHLGLDLIHQTARYFNHYPKPYTGFGYLLFSLTTFCYLANSAWLLWCSGKASNNTTLKQVSGLILFSCAFLILGAYPAITGIKLLTLFYAYYGSLGLVSIIALIKDLRTNLNWSSAILMMLGLGGLAELIMLIVFSFQYYWLILVCNGMFYLAILGVCAIIPKYRNLLKP